MMLVENGKPWTPTDQGVVEAFNKTIKSALPQRPLPYRVNLLYLIREQDQDRPSDGYIQATSQSFC